MVNSLVGKAFTLLIMITFLFSTSCTSMRVIESQPETIQSELKKGDVVRVVTEDGRDLNFKIVEIDTVAITGEDQKVLFSEITKLEIKQPDAGKTVISILLIGGIVFVAVLLVGEAAYAN